MMRSTHEERKMRDAEGRTRVDILKVVVVRSVDDPRYGQITMGASDLLRGDPDAALFQVPANYKMVSQPSVGAVQWDAGKIVGYAQKSKYSPGGNVRNFPDDRAAIHPFRH
jgi:hypothetical protein